MSDAASSSWQPEPEPQNALERLMPKAAVDHSLDGKMWRLLWESEVHTFIPDHPEMRGEHELTNGDSLPICRYEDAEGPFVAVFTSEAAAEHGARLAPVPKPAIASLPAEAFFHLIHDGETTVRVNPGMRANIIMGPEAVAGLVAGEFTHRRPSLEPGEKTRVFPVPAAELPVELREGIRAFCEKRRVPLAVYVFHPADPATGGRDRRELHFVLWLRDADNDFYNDFGLLAAKLVPKPVNCRTAVVTTDGAGNLDYLQQCTPLWPVVGPE